MSRSAFRLIATVAVPAAVLLACSGADTVPTAAHEHDATAAARPAKATLQQELAALRAAMAPHHDLAVARANGFPDAVTPCWYHGDLGAMGYHFGELARFDGTVDALLPEALVYEPLAGGKYKLVAVEYIVPISAWAGDELPQLYGQTFQTNTDLGIYLLHVWPWKQNPAGTFASWNPRVSCQHAAESEDRGATH